MTINKNDLAKTISEKHDLTIQKTLDIISDTFDEIEKALSLNIDVNIVGFGCFKTVKRPDRIATNPQTGKTFPLASRKIVKFVLGKHLKNLHKSK
jgi:integration host factor subunit alpha